MTDVDMFQFIGKGLCDGISHIANRHGEANDKYMSGYDSSKPSKYIMYLDANNRVVIKSRGLGIFPGY